MILNPRLFMWTPPVMNLMLIVGTTGNYPHLLYLRGGGVLVAHWLVHYLIIIAPHINIQ